MATFSVILPAAGKSARFQDKNYKKPFAPLDGRAVWLHSAERFLNRDDVKQLILVISPEDREMFQQRFAANVVILGIEVVDGGRERVESVENGLARVRSDIDFVVIHDAARPCLAPEWIDRVFQAGEKTDAAILGVPVSSTLKKLRDDNTVAETVSRQGIWAAQTPQVFGRQLLLDAFARRTDAVATDEAQLVENTGHAVTVVRGSPINLKITSREDLRIAAHMLKAMPKPNLLGPAHPFADDDHWR